MDNLEIAHNRDNSYDSDITGNPVIFNVSDNVCCFITNKNKLIINQYFSSTNQICDDIDDNIANSAIQIKYLSSCKVLFIATTTGLILYDPSSTRITVLHEFANQIATTSWNPNETVLIVVDVNNEMYSFTLEESVIPSHIRISEINNVHLDEAVPASLYVGWGSHETQFTGAPKKEGGGIKEEIVDPNGMIKIEGEPMVKDEECMDDDVSETDEIREGPPVISWRLNGEQFVVNFRKGNGRVLKVFTVHLNPQYESRVYTDLLAPTSFGGRGNFIACTTHPNDDDNRVVVFERNCQEKMEFGVAQNEGCVKHIEFHPEMHMLAVYSEHARFGVLNVYLNSNARWYLKQQVVYPADELLLSLNWTNLADRTTCILNVLTVVSMERITFKMVINSYPESNLVAVVDGSSVHFTRFYDEIIPPPMASISLTFERPVRAILFDPILTRFLFITSNNMEHNYIYEGGIFTPHDGIGLPDLALNPNNDSSDIIKRINITADGIEYEIILDRNLNLTINGSVFCTNVLSMYIHQCYLILSHVFCRLYCIRLSQKNLSNSDWDLDTFYSREVEQGSKIVGISRGIDVIVELPRGNLEAVTCRIIAVDTVQNLLIENRWEDAIDYIRDLRLNWNLLIDLSPTRFSDHIPEFIAAAESTSALNNIVSEFSGDNCLDTMYQQCLAEDLPPFFEYSKTDIFLKLLEEMNRLNAVSNLNGIVALQTKHFTVKAALMSVRGVFEMGQVDICKRAVARILLYRNGRDVINDAYSLYNVAFLTFIYACCSEDPRSFVPELNQLSMLKSPELRFKMNLHAKNYKGATKYLTRLTGFNQTDIVDFIIRHDTQKIAYENTPQNNPNFSIITKLYANSLAQRTRYDEAGLILSKAQMYGDAIEEYKKALNWRQVLSTLEMTNAEEPYKQEILLSLANELVNHKRVDEAVILYEYHCDAYVRAIEVLTDKKMFEKALCLAKKYGARDVLANIIIPAIEQYRENLKERIVTYETFFLECYERLQKIRRQKYLAYKARLDNEDEDIDDNNDLHSEYGSVMSVASGSSRGSTTSSRNRRKQEKKKIDLRKGGVYEDIALIRQLYLISTESFELGQEVRDICLTLIDPDSLGICCDIHEKLSNLQDLVKDHIPRIWSPVFLEARASAEPSIMAVVENRSELDDVFKTPPPDDQLKDDWKLVVFSRNPK